MIRNSKKAILILTLLLQHICSYGQIQTAAEAGILEKLELYCKQIPREEVYVLTDREEYIAGENVWFRIFLIDRQSNRPSANSDLAYFELLNPDNMPIFRKRIKLDKGFGQGQIVLPDSLSSGKYTIRAYSNWMKNFLPDNCYIQNINVFNALSSRDFKDRQTPENEVSGDANKPIIPLLAEKGISLRTNNFIKDTLEIGITADPDFIARNGNDCILLIQTRGEVNYSGPVKLKTGVVKILMLKSLLSPGVNQIVVFNARGLPLSERYIYTPQKDINSLKVNLAESYKTRSKIIAEFVIDNQQASGEDLSKFSVSVIPETDYHYVLDLSDYMVFGSEFGLLPDELTSKKLDEISPELIDNFLSSKTSNWIDWNRISRWDLPDIKYKMEKGEHFIYGKLINKSTQMPDTGQYLFFSSPGKKAVFRYAVSDKTGSFSFKLPISEINQDIIVQPENADRNNIVKMEPSFSEEYPAYKSSYDPSSKISKSYIKKWSVNYQVSKIFGITSAGVNESKPPPLPQLVRFYGRPDIELIMDDYIKLPVMTEVFFELIPGVFLKERKNQYEITIMDPVTKQIFTNPPVLFVDGVVIHDASVIAGLDPERVERIDVVKEKYFVGDYLFSGLINVTTRAADFNSVTLPEYAVRMQYRVIDQVNTFLSPNYSKPEYQADRTPDFRNTLFWNPSVVLDNTGKASIEFWSSDIKSNYVINIQGVSSMGKIVSYRKVLTVE